MPEYADLEIRILEKQEEGYPVEITFNNEQQFPRGYLDPTVLPWKSRLSPKEDGERLLNWLLADPSLKTTWAEVRGQQPQRRIRLRIDATAPELHTIPWELLRDPVEGGVPQDLAAASATPFSRYLAGRWQPGGPILKRPVRVLVAIAAPDNLVEKNLAPIDPQEEWELLQAVTEEQKDLQLDLLPQPCTLLALEEALKEGYHVLHFIGHGAFRSSDQKSVLYLADQNNQAVLVHDEKVAGMLARQLADTDVPPDEKLRMVFLSSCQTATRSPAEAFRGLAPQLVAAGVPAVLAMQDLVPIDTARQFANTFYRQLLIHGQVDLASNEARSAVLSSELTGAAIPVLFSRLRANQLLGKRGYLSSGRDDIFWPFLLDAIDAGQVVVFLGPRVTAGLLPDRPNIAEKLAERYGYPLPDKRNLSRVAQFISVNARKDPRATVSKAYMRLLQRSLFLYLDIQPSEEDKRRFKDATLSTTSEELNWAERVLDIRESEIHHQLADLQLPLYVTTNIDNFMEQALKHKGLAPRRLGLRPEQSSASTPQFVLTPEPSKDQPVILHLNGHDGDPEQLKNLVLSEDDYMKHLVRLSRDQQTSLPMNVLRMLAEYSFIFLGYQLDDWEFKLILHGLLPEIAQVTSSRKRHVGVQLELRDMQGLEKASQYLGDYMSQFNIDIYWGTSQQFTNDLHSRWQEKAEEIDDDWGF